jgi:hypothetical protein
MQHLQHYVSVQQLLALVSLNSAFCLECLVLIAANSMNCAVCTQHGGSCLVDGCDKGHAALATPGVQASFCRDITHCESCKHFCMISHAAGRLESRLNPLMNR